MQDEFMALAIEEAKKALSEGEVPVGAVIVKQGEVIAQAHNRRENDLDIAGHAEILAMQEAAKKLGTWIMEACTIYITLEPCMMCGAALLQSRISSIVYGADDPQYGSITGKTNLFSGAKTLVYRGVEKDACAQLINDFFAEKRQ